LFKKSRRTFGEKLPNKNEIALANDGEISIMSRTYPSIPLSNGLIFRCYVSPAGCSNNSHIPGVDQLSGIIIAFL